MLCYKESYDQTNSYEIKNKLKVNLGEIIEHNTIFLFLKSFRHVCPIRKQIVLRMGQYYNQM